MKFWETSLRVLVWIVTMHFHTSSGSQGDYGHSELKPGDSLGWMRTNKVKFNNEKMKVLLVRGRIDSGTEICIVLNGILAHLKE